jgi:very-short-patch-repair endonuclease
MSNRITTSEFIKRAKHKHGDKYDYSKVKYVKSKANVTVICKEHGEFEQRADVHLISGCKKCSDDKKRMNIKQFITSANRIHNKQYEYNLTIYKSYNDKVKIVCKTHGVFEQTPHNHLKGQGCSHCRGGVSYNTREFIKRSSKIHSNKYEYNRCIYTKANKKVTITCKQHGDFKQYPFNHINGRGCPSCSKLFPVMENKWLDSLSISRRQYKINNFKVDGYDQKTKTIYEFYGDFWHGNPNVFNGDDINTITKTTFAELYKKTINRERYLKSLGYNVVSIWESEYKNKLEKNDR